MRRKGFKRLKALLTAAIAVVSLLCVMTAFYICVVWGNIAYLTNLRNIWIETAMTTFTHQWLATSFFPDWLITDVMNQQELNPYIEITPPPRSPDDPSTSAMPTLSPGQTADPLHPTVRPTAIPTPTPIPDILGQKDLVVGKPDKNGNIVEVNDVEQGIVIVKVKGKNSLGNFEGRLVLVDDPSRVFVGVTDKKEKVGRFICDYLDMYDAIVGMNASGFEDPDGHGKGGVIHGLCYSEGEAWGVLDKQYASMAFTKDNQLLVGNFYDWDAYNVRDGLQFIPVLISNGEVVVGKNYSLQPRTILAQCANGVVLMMVIDGRQPGYSMGATYLQCVDILLSYGAVNACACDGGSSSVVAYNGKLLNKTSSPMKDTGRYLPNAILVRRK